MKLFHTNRQIERLKAEVAEQVRKELLAKNLTQSDVDNIRKTTTTAFNLENPSITVFSIERLNQFVPFEQEKTVVGYYFNSDIKSAAVDEKVVHREWSLYCSRADHNALVEEFRARLAVKPNQSVPAGKKILKG
jgi:hypothetical protein